MDILKQNEGSTLHEENDVKMDKRISSEFSRLISYIVNSMRASSEEEQVIKDYIKLVLVSARKYVRHNVEYEDLIMAGIIGLIEAVRNFDITRSTNFGMYAITRIKGRMYEFCINNMTSVTIPTHVGKVKIYVYKIYKLLEKEPVVFENNISLEEIVRTWEHPQEQALSKHGFIEIRGIKKKIDTIATHSKTTYEKLIELAFKSIITEVSGEEIHNFSVNTAEEAEKEIDSSKLVELIRKTLGDKKAAVYILHMKGYTNDEIARELFEHKLTPRKISRQAIGGLLRSAKRLVDLHIN